MRYYFYIPLLIFALFVQSYCTYGQQIPDYIYHTVKGNENVYRISLIYKVPMDSIRRWNFLDQNYMVIEGMRLIIKHPQTLPRDVNDNYQSTDNKSHQKYQKKVLTGFHIVGEKENLFRISLLYHVSIDSIRRLNHLDQSSVVIVGQRLIVPFRKSDSRVAANITDEKMSPSEKLTPEISSSQAPDSLGSLKKVLSPDSLLTAQQKKALPVFDDPVEKDTGTTFIEIVKYYYDNSNYLFHFALFVNLFFLLSSIFMALGLISRRMQKGYIEHKRLNCQNRYRDFITDWLYEENIIDVPESLIKELKDSVYRDVFISELLSLHNNLIGESAERLAELYNLAGFKKYSIQKINRSFWHLKAKGFRELAQMKIKENYMIYKYLNSGNVTLSIEAQLAWIQLNPDDPLSFYDDPNVKLTEWGQLNLLIALRRSGRIPDFGRWLLSTSKSVSLFALKMEGIYKEFDNVDLVAQRLDDSDKDIRHEAICTLGRLALHSQGYKLQLLFPSEELENKTEIIRSLTMMSESTNIPFFEATLLNETDVNLRILAAKGLVSLGDIGTNRLDLLFLDADPILQKIINHAKDDRI